MTKVCPDCRGDARRRRDCKTCNPAGGVLDGLVSLGRRARNTATGRTATVGTDASGRKTTTTRTGFLGTETTRTTKPAAKKPAKRRATAKKRKK